MEIRDLAHFQALMNALSAVLLITGYYLIRSGNRQAHKKAMLSAVGTSALFLISYLIYHWHVGQTPFNGQGDVRYVYFTILIIHIIAAIICLPMILITIFRALRELFDKHKRIARFTLPLWLFVSVSGLVVYAMAFHIYPPAV